MSAFAFRVALRLALACWLAPRTLGDPGHVQQSCDSSKAAQVADTAEDSELMRVEFLQQDLLASKASEVLLQGRAHLASSSTTSTTPPPTGMSLNSAGDLSAFVAALVTNIFFLGFCACVFSVLRLRYPIMYYNNVLEGFAPSRPAETTWGWVGPTLSVTIDEVAKCITLDHALLLQFTHFCMRVLLVIGIPMFCIMGPVNMVFGGNAAGEDHLSYFSYGNIQMNSNLFWVHAFVVWYVVIVVSAMTHNEMRRFLERRFRWLRQVPENIANTVLVESIPEQFQSAEKLRAFIQKIQPGAAIKSVYVAKDTDVLLALIGQRDYAQAKLREAEAMLAKDPSTVPMVRDGYLGGQREAIPHWRAEVGRIEPEVRAERKRIETESSKTGGVNTSSAFVTFHDRSAAELLLRLDRGLSSDEDEWEMFHAPQPSDILWADLTQDDTAQQVRTAIGYLLVIGLYFLYMPLVIGITNIAKIVDFSDFGLGVIQPFWQGFAPTMGLQFMVAFLPTFLIMIFRGFFTCRAEAWQQQKLQVWYFWFQVVFVLLATAVGQNVNEFTMTLFEDPTSIFRVLAETMPYATHFYMNFLVLQWMAHGMVFTRYFPLFKFKAAMSIYEEQEAKAFAEPEDQDYYGIGSRSARWSIAMAISIVFGTLSPPINVLGFLTFGVCRIVYGYLFAFAETKKADTGGAFYVTQIKHIFVALILYCILMIGVLIMRAETYGPGLIAIPSLVWTVLSLHKLNGYSWEHLPIQEMITEDASDIPKKKGQGEFIQPEMVED